MSPPRRGLLPASAPPMYSPSPAHPYHTHATPTPHPLAPPHTCKRQDGNMAQSRRVYRVSRQRGRKRDYGRGRRAAVAAMRNRCLPAWLEQEGAGRQAGMSERRAWDALKPARTAPTAPLPRLSSARYTGMAVPSPEHSLYLVLMCALSLSPSKPPPPQLSVGGGPHQIGQVADDAQALHREMEAAEPRAT